MDANAPLLDDVADAQGPVDSDEEKDLVMAAIARSRPRPMDQHIFVPLRRRYNYLRVKEMLSTALGGGRGGIFGAASGGALMAGAEDGSVAASTDAQRRPSLAQPSTAAGSSKGSGPNGLGAAAAAAAAARKPSNANVGTTVAT